MSWARAVAFLVAVDAARPYLVNPSVPNKDEQSEQSCGRCVNSQADFSRRSEFILRAEKPLPGEYFVSSQQCRSPQRLGSASMTPWLNETDPLNSSIHIFLDPKMVQKMQRQNSKAYVCSDSLDSCICELEILPLPWSALDLLQRALDSLPTEGAKKLSMQLLVLEDSCRPKYLLDSLLMLILPWATLCILGLVYVCLSITRTFRDSQHLLEDLQVSTSSETALVIPGALSDLKNGSLQVLKLTSLMVSLQAVVLERIKKDASETLVCFAVIWPVAFGVVAILRILRTMCHTQLTHAALSVGIALQTPPPGRFHDLFAGAGSAFLALCVAVALADLRYWKLFLLLAGLFLGPSLSLMGEILKARTQDESMVGLQGTHRLRSLMHLFREVQEKDAAAEQKLRSGKLPILPFGEVIRAGRAGRDVLQALRDSTEDGAPETGHAGQWNLLDLRWHGPVLHEMSGSRAGFLTWPVLVMAVTVLLGASLGQAGTYLCSAPELAGLKLNVVGGHLDFQPWIRKYDVKLDRTFKQVFVVAESKFSSTKRISIDKQASADDQSSFAKLVPLRFPKSVPQSTEIQVEGLRRATATYTVQFLPKATIPVNLKLKADGFKRSMRWSELPGAVISLPSKTKSVKIEVSLAAYQLDIPEDCSRGRSNGTEFCTFHELKKWGTDHGGHGQDFALCKDHCRHDPHCLIAFPSTRGCFLTFGGLDLPGAWRDNSISAKACFAAGADWQCHDANVTKNRLAAEIEPQWLDATADLKLDLSLAVGDQDLKSQSERLKLLRGPPQLLEVLVNLTAEDFEGGLVLLNASAEISDGDILVTMDKYLPYEIAKLNLIVAPLLPDKDFEVSWESVAVAPVNETEVVTFQECSKSAFLMNRFRCCRADRQGWPADMAKISLKPWRPEMLEDVFFQVKPRKEPAPHKPGLPSGAVRRLQIRLRHAQHAAEWAVPAETATDRCNFSVPSNFTWLSPLHVDMVVAFSLSPEVQCEYMRRHCGAVNASGLFRPGTSGLDMKDLRGLSSELQALQASSGMHPEAFGNGVLDWSAKLLLCAVDYMTPLPYWANVTRWHLCSPSHRGLAVLGLEHESDLLCGPSEGPSSVPVRVGSLLQHMKSTPSAEQRHLVREACSRLVGSENGRTDALVLQKLLQGVLAVGSPQTFSQYLNMSECSVLVGNAAATAVWETVLKRPDSPEWLQPALAHPGLAGALLETAANAGCLSCIQVLQPLGDSKPQVKAKDLQLGGHNGVALLKADEMNAVLGGLVSFLAKCYMPGLVRVGAEELSADTAVKLLRVLRGMELLKLRELTLGAAMTPSTTSALLDLLAFSPLQTLYLSESRMGAFTNMDWVANWSVALLNASKHLGQTIRLKSMELESSGISLEGADMLWQSLSEMTFLATIHVRIHMSIVGYFGLVLSCGTIQANHAQPGHTQPAPPAGLHLWSCDFYQHTYPGSVGATLDQILQAVRKLPKDLRKLSYQRRSLGAPVGSWLGAAFAPCPTLEEVDLSYSDLTREDVRNLVQSLPTTSRLALMRLRLNHAELEDAADALGQLLVKLPALQELDISGNNLTDAGLSSLGESIRASTPFALKRLSLARMGGKAIGVLVQVLPKMPALEEVDLSGNNLTNNDVRNLVQSLPTTSHLALMRLRLNNADLEDCGDALGQLLTKFPALEVLDVSDSKLSDGLPSLVDSIRSSSHLKPAPLKRLQLGSTGAKADGMRAVAKLVCESPFLEVLELADQHQPTDAGVEAFAEVLSQCDHAMPLKHLELDCCHNRSSLEKVVTALRNYSSLEVLGLYSHDRPWRADWKEIVEDALSAGSWPKLNSTRGGCGDLVR